MKILVIQQKMIGDVLTSSVLFEVLKKEHPTSELHYLINSHTYPVVKGHPFIDDFIFFTPEIENNKLQFFNLLRRIKRENYDVVIDVYAKLSSSLITLFSCANTRISYYKNYSSFIYNHTYKNKTLVKTTAGLAIENRLMLLDPLLPIPVKNIKPKVFLTDKEKKAASEFLNKNGIDLKQPLYMISVLGSSNSKTYPFSYIAKLIDQIVSETNAQILFNYIPKQQTDALAIYNLCTATTQKHIYFDVFGKSLRDFMSISHFCNAIIGNEGGAINMGKALGVPTFTIFSPWIKKETWSMFEDGVNNISVHLKDYKPELFEHKATKDLKPNWKTLYDSFKPELINLSLKNFLDINLARGSQTLE